MSHKSNTRNILGNIQSTTKNLKPKLLVPLSNSKSTFEIKVFALWSTEKNAESINIPLFNERSPGQKAPPLMKELMEQWVGQSMAVPKQPQATGRSEWVSKNLP